jgi:hypothetical protein
MIEASQCAKTKARPFGGTNRLLMMVIQRAYSDWLNTWILSVSPTKCSSD